MKAEIEFDINVEMLLREMYNLDYDIPRWVGRIDKHDSVEAAVKRIEILINDLNVKIEWVTNGGFYE